MSIPEKTPTAKTTDDVGYCKPPKASQWKPGQSGNPAGKKKGTKNFGSQFQKVLGKFVSVKDGVKVKKVTLMELVVNAAWVHGMMGDAKNGAQALKLTEEFGLETPKPYPPMPGKVWKSKDGKYCTSEWVKKWTAKDYRDSQKDLNMLKAMMKEHADFKAGK